MRETFVTKNLDFVSKYNNYSESDKAILKYGFEVLYTMVTKTIGLLFISYFLNILKETIILMLMYFLIRLFGHGAHAKKSSHCWIVSIMSYTLFPLLIKYWVVPKFLIIVIGSVAILCFIKWAPADTPKKPIVNKKKRIILKLFTVIISVTLLGYSVFSSSSLISNSIFYSLIMNIIAINPITYKIFGITFNNYKNFN